MTGCSFKRKLIIVSIEHEVSSLWEEGATILYAYCLLVYSYYDFFLSTLCHW